MEGTLSFPDDMLDRAFEAQAALSELGVGFDTGTGFGWRDWELDWSLHGMTAEQVIEWVKEKYPDLYAVHKWSPRGNRK